jgi:hypothetical protein
MLVCDKTESAKRRYSKEIKRPGDLRRFEIHIALKGQSVKRQDVLQSRGQGESR